MILPELRQKQYHSLSNRLLWEQFVISLSSKNSSTKRFFPYLQPMIIQRSEHSLFHSRRSHLSSHLRVVVAQAEGRQHARLHSGSRRRRILARAGCRKSVRRRSNWPREECLPRRCGTSCLPPSVCLSRTGTSWIRPRSMNCCWPASRP